MVTDGQRLYVISRRIPGHDDDEDKNCRVKGAMKPSSSSHRLLLEEKRKADDGAKLKKRSFAVFLFLIREEKEEDASEKLRLIFPVVVVIIVTHLRTRIYTHKWATTGACRECSRGRR